MDSGARRRRGYAVRAGWSIPFNRSGSHVERGFILASGPGIPVSGTIADAKAVDLAPTILSLLGVPVPRYMDGRPLFSDVADAVVS